MSINENRKSRKTAAVIFTGFQYQAINCYWFLFIIIDVIDYWYWLNGIVWFHLMKRRLKAIPRVPFFAVGVGEKFIIKKKRWDRCPAQKVTDDGHCQLGHLQRELVSLLWPLTDKVEV